MIPSGRYLTCANCGRLFPEGDACGEITCSDKCRREEEQKNFILEQKIQQEITSDKPLDYQI